MLGTFECGLNLNPHPLKAEGAAPKCRWCLRRRLGHGFVGANAVGKMGRLGCGGRQPGFVRTYNRGGVVHVAAEEFVLCADDDSLSCGSFADDVSVGRGSLSMQLAGMPDGVFDGKGILPGW